MAKKTNCTINGRDYYRITKVVGHKLNDKGIEIPVRKSFYGDCKSDAEAKFQKYIDKKNAGIETKTQYFGILADDWITTFFLTDGDLKDSTKRRYLAAWNRNVKKLDFYHMPLDEVTGKTLKEAYNKMIASGLPVSELKQINKLMVRFYNYIETEGLGRNVTRSLKVPKEKINGADEEISIWTDDEIKKILGGFDKADNRFRLRFLIILAYYTGCRKSELLALKYSDITPSGVRITKTLADVSDGLKDGKFCTHTDVTDPKTTKSKRTVDVDPIVYEELQRHKAWHMKEQVRKGYRSDFIFTTESGGFYNNKNLDVALNRYYKKIGVEPKTLHTYRHTYASNLFRAGYPAETIRQMLGHKSVETTARYYININEESKQGAAMALRQFAM